MSEAVLAVEPGALLSAARERARGRIGVAMAELKAPDALASFARARALGHDAALWVRPADGSATLGLGTAARVRPRGGDRVAGLRREWSKLRGAVEGPGELRAFVGVSFDEGGDRRDGPRWSGFGSAELVVPRIRVEWRDGATLAHVAAREDDEAESETSELWDDLVAGTAGARPEVSERVGASPAASSCASGRRATPVRGPEIVREIPSRDAWRKDVLAARDAIHQGLLEKVVLARAACVRVAESAVPTALAALVDRARGSTVYAVARGGAVFLGATPESLVTLEGGVARVSCVAGTAARADDATGLALLGSDKDLREHEVVVRAARGTLGRYCDEVTVRGPELLGLVTLWHLASDVRGRVRRGVELLDLAAELHPTPAVCGTPRDAAARFIAEHEPFARGWYAGALGWVDAAGEGELVVALRGAVVRPERAWVFAGCGIVDGSDPDAELAEADAKMRPTIAALSADPYPGRADRGEGSLGRASPDRGSQ